MEALTNGDVIGLLLDLDAQSLAVYLNSRRLGLLVSSDSPEGIVPLVAGKRPVQWTVALSEQSFVKMAASEPPPVLAEVIRAELQQTHAFWVEHSSRRERAPSPQPWQRYKKKMEEKLIQVQLRNSFGVDASSLLARCVHSECQAN